MLPVQSTLHGWSQLVISCFVYPLESKLLLLDTISALAPYSSSSSSTKERASSSVSFCNRRCLRFFHNHRRDLHCVWKQSNEKNCSTALWPLFSNGWYYSGRPRNSCPPLCRTCDWVNSSLLLQWFRFTATSSFVVFGLLIHDYAVVCLCVGFTATYCEKIVLYYLTRKYERKAYIAFSIGGVVLLSALLMTVQSLVSMAEGGGKLPAMICGEG